jgi:predicted alpha-1,2-mannosidase
LTIAGNDTITGGRRVNIWGKGRHIYFAMKFSKPFLSAELYSDDQPTGAGAQQVSGKLLKCVAHFKTAAGEVIRVKVGLSGVSAEGAMKNLEKEIPAWDFAKVRRDAHTAWARELSKIRIETADTNKKTIFYSSLYHSMLAPTLFDDIDGQYRGMDEKVHFAAGDQHNYSTYSTWDTYRALHPLYTLFQSERVPDLVNCLIRMANESPAGMPVWPLQGEETGCMTGYHSAPIIAEAVVKGFEGIDLANVYGPLMNRAMSDDYRGLGYYRKLGYIPSDREEESATKTLEYAYDDWAAAHIAQALGHEDDYKSLVARSGNYRNLFDKSTGFIRPKLENGEWAGPFDPKLTGTSKRWRDFTESNSWQGTWAAQHDGGGYIVLLGGREKMIEKLDALFDQSSEINGEVPVDMTGLVGMYAHGNEPSHHIAYLYVYAGAPYKTQARVRNLLETMYHNAPDGLAGNEDCGQMSAWYLISSLGFYAVDPVSGNYVLGSPLFDKATVDLGGGKKLVIEAKGQSPKSKYVRSVTLNGNKYEKAWFRHADIADGGTIVFEMGEQPNREFGAADAAAPPSMSTHV